MSNLIIQLEFLYYLFRAESISNVLSFNPIWIFYFFVSIALLFFVLTTKGELPHFVRHFLRLRMTKELTHQTHEVFVQPSLEYSRVRIKDILPRVPTQWLFISWTLSCLIGWIAYYVVTHGY